MLTYRPQWDSFYTQDQNYYHHGLEDVGEFAPLTEKVDADICIIGGGFAGLSVAYHAHKMGKRVVLLERHHLGFGASGRNGGQVLPGFQAAIEDLAGKLGRDEARALWDLSMEGVAIVDEIIDAYKIACDRKPGNLILAKNDASFAQLEKGQAVFREMAGYETTLLGREELHPLIGTDYYTGALLSPKGFHLHPMKYIDALGKALVASGVQIYCHSAAEAIRSTAGKYYISTPLGQVMADKLILCGGSYLGNLFPSLRPRYVLVRNGQIATAPLSAEQNVLAGDHCAFENDKALHFFRKTADNRLLFGGGDSIQPLDSTIRTQEKIIDNLKHELPHIFPQLEGVKIDFGWGGYLGMTTSFMPNIGQMDEGLFFVNGFNGHGINTTHICGKLLAEASCGESDRYRTFDKISNMAFPGHGHWDHHLAKIGILLYRLGLL